jgi:hypothetical protein
MYEKWRLPLREIHYSIPHLFDPVNDMFSMFIEDGKEFTQSDWRFLFPIIQIGTF